jgi:hypothetical protein
MKRTLFDSINSMILESLANTHTILIAKVERVDAKTIDARPVINRKVNDKSITLPVFSKIPPVFLQGGSSYTAHPIAVGDYCLLLVSERCFDKWYNGQDFKIPPEYRMHDYSDCFAIVGVNPFAAAKTIPSVITHIGDTYQEGDYVHIGNRTQTGNHTQEGDINLTGNLTVIGNITLTGDFSMTGTMLVNGINIGTHFHSQDADSNGDSEQPTNGPQS